jgi:hypothetical protein
MAVGMNEQDPKRKKITTNNSTKQQMRVINVANQNN